MALLKLSVLVAALVSAACSMQERSDGTCTSQKDECGGETTKHFLVVGAGFSGAVVARELVENLDCRVTVIDERSHIGGNCHTERDHISGVMMHMYGPHIFHTSNTRVWNYANRFDRFVPFVLRTKAITSRGIFSLPINLLTINQFFGKQMNPSDAQVFVASLSDKNISEPQNFEEQALKFVGRDLYEAFLYGYTRKQWGCEPRELPASVLKRLPVRFSYDDNYFQDPFQGIPMNGYSAVIEKILKHKNIEVKLNTSFEHSMPDAFDHCFYTGTIDGFFNYRLGRLSYRTVYFERIDADGDYQGNPILNYPDMSVPYTRIHEHKHFTPWETHEKTVAFREYSKETEPADTPFYPKNLATDKETYARYRELASRLAGVTFLGRLGTYRYLDMDKTIAAALEVADNFIARQKFV